MGIKIVEQMMGMTNHVKLPERSTRHMAAAKELFSHLRNNFSSS